MSGRLDEGGSARSTLGMVKMISLSNGGGEGLMVLGTRKSGGTEVIPDSMRPRTPARAA